ncbi:MAG: hypothetical protein J5I94_00300 [Phaeodactylibacter sp.]|nr:hypothetical protein [Phaeodactylibacter sp.]
MAVLRFFKLPKHQQYKYKPRFWDPKKEERDERLKQIEAMKGGDAEALKARLSANFRKGYAKDTSFRKRQMMRSNLILLGVLAVLIILSYLFITVYLPKIADSVGSGGAQF